MVRDELNDFLDSLGHDRKDLATIPQSNSFLYPGNVVVFYYDNLATFRSVFIVRIKRGNGTFISTRSNYLMCGFPINTTNPLIVSAILKGIYKNSRISDYYKLAKGLKAIFGYREFRTFNVRRTRYLRELHIKKKKLPELDDG